MLEPFLCKDRPEATLLLGPTGVGKTPLASLFCEEGLLGQNVQHFDFGEELRRTATGVTGLCTPEEVRFIQRILEEGVLLEDAQFNLALKIFQAFLARVGFQGSDHVMLNGLPRHLGQARALESVVRVIRLVVLHCEAEDVYQRIRNNTGGDRTGRSDDSIKMISQKLEIFRKRTEPLVAHYQKVGIPVIRLSVGQTDSALKIYGNIVAQINEYTICHTAVSPPKIEAPLM